MKVLLINGSPRANGNTAAGLMEMQRIFAQEGIETELITVGDQVIRGCVGCRKCKETGKCVFDDIVNQVAPKFEEADGIVLGTPVYFGGPNGTMLSFMDRLFYSTSFRKTMKVGAAVTAARRGGNSAAFDAMNKHFAVSGMPIATSQYWNMLHGKKPGEAAEDAEGMQTMRTLARNMAFLMKSIALGKEQYGLPEQEPMIYTNFIK